MLSNLDATFVLNYLKFCAKKELNLIKVTQHSIVNCLRKFMSLLFTYYYVTYL